MGPRWLFAVERNFRVVATQKPAQRRGDAKRRHRVVPSRRRDELFQPGPT